MYTRCSLLCRPLDRNSSKNKDSLSPTPLVCVLAQLLFSQSKRSQCLQIQRNSSPNRRNKSSSFKSLLKTLLLHSQLFVQCCSFVCCDLWLLLLTEVGQFTSVLFHTEIGQRAFVSLHSEVGQCIFASLHSEIGQLVSVSLHTEIGQLVSVSLH